MVSPTPYFLKGDRGMNKEFSLEETIMILSGMKVILGLSRTEKDAIDSAINYLEGIQDSTEEEED